MQLSDNQVKQIEEKIAQTPDALKRDTSINYTEGYFFVTFNIRNRLPLLGQIDGYYNPSTKEVTNPGVRLTELGEAVLSCWNQIPSFYPNVQLIEAQVMPEHFHGLLFMKAGGKIHLGTIIKGMMVGCTHRYWDILGINWRTMVGVNDGKADKHWTDWLHSTSLRGPSLFATGYNEVKPLTENEIAHKIAYIQANPERRLIKGISRDCFTISANHHSPNWTYDRAKLGLMSDQFLASHPDDLEQAWSIIQPRILTHNQQPSLSTVGEQSLLSAPQKLPLICHRNDSDRKEEQASAIIERAQHGSIIVSAFISPYEREIKHQLLSKGLPIIEIMGNGMNPFYKPSGQDFYYTAEGKLLQITCWNYQYQRDDKITRPMCMVMNELVRLITGINEDWWK